MANPRPLSETTLTSKNVITGIALADHMGDVNNYLPWLADALELDRPEWSDEFNRYVFPWEDAE